MHEGFVALASMLRPDPVPAVAIPVVAAVAVPPAGPSPLADAAMDVARLRLAAREAYERAMAHALDGFAREVLDRELAVAPADIKRLAARAIAEFAGYEPVGLVVATDDAACLDALPLPVRVDGELERGDVVVEVNGGAFESTQRFRLGRVLGDSLARACAESFRT